jgi:hypothetical protein
MLLDTVGTKSFGEGLIFIRYEDSKERCVRGTASSVKIDRLMMLRRVGDNHLFKS